MIFQELTERPTRPGLVQSRWIVSVDLGFSIDPTAVAVIEYNTRGMLHRRFWSYTDETRPADVVAPPKSWYTKDGSLAWSSAPAKLQVRHLERLPLQTPYPDQIAHISRLMRRPPFDAIRPQLLIDQTGVGKPIVQLFQRAGLRPIGITITGGDSEVRHGEDWHVSKLRIVSRLQAMLHTGTLETAPELREAVTLRRELQDFRAIFTDSGYARFGAREGAHDDLVLAVAQACWWASRETPASWYGEVIY